MNETNLTKFNILIKNNTVIDTDLIYIDVMNILQIKDIEFDDITIYDNKIKYKNDGKNIEFPISNISNGMQKITIQFSNCKFNNSIKFFNKIDYSFVFADCEFDSIEFDSIRINEHPSYKDFQSNYEFIMVKIRKKLTIKNCNFGGKFYINDQKPTNNTMRIDYISIKESTFNKNFKLHNCIVKDISLSGVDFKGNADFFKSKFGNKDNNKNITFSGINFNKLVIFEECIFYIKFVLEYATFESLAQFRNATFEYGLDLDKTNILKDLNFYGIKKLNEDNSKKNTTQETYKIVKYYSEKNGSVIEANKYHALELEKKRKELYFWSNFYFWKKKVENRQYNKLDWIVFNGNYVTSKFGTNWGFALGWIFIIGFLTSMFIKTGNYYSFEYIFEYVNKWELFKEILTDTPKYMSIINGDELKEYSVAFLLNKVLLGYLYYQFVTAVRKDTRK